MTQTIHTSKGVEVVMSSPDISDSERKAKLKSFAEASAKIIKNACDRMLRNGENEKAEKLWRTVFASPEPYWL